MGWGFVSSKSHWAEVILWEDDESAIPVAESKS